MRYVPLSAILLGLAACGGTPPSDVADFTRPVDYTLPAGASTIITIPAEEDMMVTFGFEIGSPSWDATADCPEMNVADEENPFLMQICGELSDENFADEAGLGPSFRGMHGGGTRFSPKDGFIRVRLKSYALEEMTFQIEANAESD